MRRITFIFAISIAACISTAAIGDAAKKDAPELSGNYAFSWVESCVTGDNTTTVSHISAVIGFDTATGTATINGYQAHGSPPVLSPLSGSAPYANTATTLTVNGTTYQVFYGAVKKNVATYLTYIGVVPGDNGATCADDATLSRQ